MFLPNRKATLLVPSGPLHDPDRKHLFILLSDPVTEEEVVLMVSISSVKPNRWHDDACMISPGEHPFIVKESFVDYSSCRIEPGEKLLNGVYKGFFVPRDPMPQSVFERICCGVMVSRRTPKDMKRFFLIHCT